MAIITQTLPQNIEEIKAITLIDLVKVLPDTISLPLNIWITGKIAKYGIGTDNLMFLIESKDEPSVEIRNLFKESSEKVGKASTVSNNWRSSRYFAVRLYNEGRLIVDKTTGFYKEIPSPTKELPKLTIEEIKSKLPQTIPWNQTLYLTGGLVKNGWSYNDADIMTFDKTDKTDLGKMRNFFSELFKWKTDVGQILMLEREPIYLYKIYEGGNLCLL